MSASLRFLRSRRDYGFKDQQHLLEAVDGAPDYHNNAVETPRLGHSIWFSQDACFGVK
jgi:hypothetical protein